VIVGFRRFAGFTRSLGVPDQPAIEPDNPHAGDCHTIRLASSSIRVFASGHAAPRPVPYNAGDVPRLRTHAQETP
jgi:hypothetical protein